MLPKNTLNRWDALGQARWFGGDATVQSLTESYLGLVFRTQLVLKHYVEATWSGLDQCQQAVWKTGPFKRPCRGGCPKFGVNLPAVDK